MPGSGKSLLGRKLAQQLHYVFRDLDEDLVKRVGMSIRDIFAQRGEDEFRVLETRILSESLKEEHSVIATGGGCVLREENRTQMRADNLVIYFYATVETLLHNLEDQLDRPLLMGGDRRKLLQNMLSQREELYHQTAHLVFKVDGLTKIQAGQELCALVERVVTA